MTCTGSLPNQRIALACLFVLTAVFTGAKAEHPFDVTAVTSFDEPWAMAFLPDGRLLVTEKAGRLLLVTQSGEKTPVAGVPAVDYGGKGGFRGAELPPELADNPPRHPD